MATACSVFQRVTHVAARIEHVRQRYGEHLGNLERIGAQLARILYPADEGGDAIARDGDVRRHRAQHLHPLRREPDLFLGFAQSCLHRTGIFGLHPPAGKTDLSRVMGEMRRAAREQHSRPFFAGHQGGEYRRRPADLASPFVACSKIKRPIRRPLQTLGDALAQPFGRGKQIQEFVIAHQFIVAQKSGRFGSDFSKNYLTNRSVYFIIP